MEIRVETWALHACPERGIEKTSILAESFNYFAEVIAILWNHPGNAEKDGFYVL